MEKKWWQQNTVRCAIVSGVLAVMAIWFQADSKVLLTATAIGVTLTAIFQRKSTEDTKTLVRENTEITINNQKEASNGKSEGDQQWQISTQNPSSSMR